MCHSTTGGITSSTLLPFLPCSNLLIKSLAFSFIFLICRLEQLVVLDPDNSKASFHLALLYLDLKDIENSEQMFLRTLRIQPNYRSALYNLGLLYNHLHKYTEAVNQLSKLAAMYPDHINGVQLLGDCFMRLQQPQKAKEMYELVLSQNPKHVTALHNLGMSLDLLHVLSFLILRRGPKCELTSH